MYVSYLGRSKTYILGAGFAMSICMFISAPFSLKMIENKQYNLIVWQWFFINFVNCFMQIASEAWCVTILEKKLAPKATVMLSIGQTLGIFLSYNLFMPLNSVTWLNKYIYKSKPVTVSPP